MMHPRWLLALVPWLLGLPTGCSKKVDLHAAASIKSMVTYTLDGRSMSGTAKVRVKPAGASGSATEDSLYVQTYAQTTMGAEEYIHLVFHKQAGQSAIAYQLGSLSIDVANSSTYAFDSPHTATLTQTSPGRWSGTFSGTRVDKLGRALSSVTNGVFTEIAE